MLKQGGKELIHNWYMFRGVHEHIISAENQALFYENINRYASEINYKVAIEHNALWESNNTGQQEYKVDYHDRAVPQLIPGSIILVATRNGFRSKNDKKEISSENMRCYGYGAGRATGNSTLSETPETTDTCASLFNDRADLLNPEEWFLFADYTMAKDKDPLTTQNFNLLKAALLEVMAEGEITDLEVSPVSLGGGSPRQGVRFKTPYGWVRLKDMSLGYQTLVVWLTDFASKLFIRYPKSKNPLREPAIVLIDEIDLHLHPSWQRKLISSLSKIFANTQFIATAHSPLVVQAATDADANVVLLKREGDETIVYQGHDLPDVRRWRIEQILSSELFDDTPPLSVQTEADLERRNKLRLKKRLTAKEKAELAALDAALTSQPAGTTAPERRAEDLLAQLARNLGQSEMLQ